jgi:hypothetical protein
MSNLIILPTPISYTALSPGNLIADPLNPSSQIFASSSSPPTLSNPLVQTLYRDHLTHDIEGRLVSSLATRKPSSYELEHSVHLHADQSLYQSIQDPVAAFETLRRSSDAQDYFRAIAASGGEGYYVTAIQKLRNPSFRSPKADDASRAAPLSAKLSVRLPSQQRRDSSLDTLDSSTDAILAVSLLRLRCLLGAPVVPHSPDDVDYAWSYHMLDEDVQLSIGLGKAFMPAEFRRAAGIVAEEDFDDGEAEGDECEGIGGF